MPQWTLNNRYHTFLFSFLYGNIITRANKKCLSQKTRNQNLKPQTTYYICSPF